MNGVCEEKATAASFFCFAFPFSAIGLDVFLLASDISETSSAEFYTNSHVRTRSKNMG